MDELNEATAIIQENSGNIRLQGNSWKDWKGMKYSIDPMRKDDI